MRYYKAKLKAVREEKVYKNYTADSFYSIVGALGGKNMVRYADIFEPPVVDNRDPHTIAMERAEKLGLKVVGE